MCPNNLLLHIFKSLKNSQKNLLSSKAIYQTHFRRTEHHLDSFNSNLEVVKDLCSILGLTWMILRWVLQGG